MKTLALTTVQDQLFQIINQVLQTGTAVEVEHQGRKVRNHLCIRMTAGAWEREKFTISEQI